MMGGVYLNNTRGQGVANVVAALEVELPPSIPHLASGTTTGAEATEFTIEVDGAAQLKHRDCWLRLKRSNLLSCSQVQ